MSASRLILLTQVSTLKNKFWMMIAASSALRLLSPPPFSFEAFPKLCNGNMCEYREKREVPGRVNIMRIEKDKLQ